jgi:ribulose-5-phosphate 4-epimerase/fuculose-1-phosphate aldolase
MKNKSRVVYVVSYRSRGKARSAVDVVTLHPPNAWHLDYVGDEDDEAGDYVLTSLGGGKTKLDMRFKERYKIRNAPSKAQDVKHTNELWDKYVASLEKDYRRMKC